MNQPCAVTVLQDQQADIREWVAHHAAVGAGEHMSVRLQIVAAQEKTSNPCPRM